MFPQAVDAMTSLNREVSAAGVASGVRCATAVIDSAAVPYLDGARQSLAAGHAPGEIPGGVVIGELVPRRAAHIVIR